MEKDGVSWTMCWHPLEVQDGQGQRMAHAGSSMFAERLP